jgi:hypothetical protein
MSPKRAKKKVRRDRTDDPGNNGDVVLKEKIVMGGYGYKVAADAAAADFLRPSVFAYQSALFPQPDAHGVKVTIAKATSRELKTAEQTSPLYPWAVDLDVEVVGPAAKAAAWMQAFKDRTRGIRL